VFDYQARQEVPERVEAGELRGRPLRRAMTLVTVSWVFGAVWVTAIGGAPFSLFARDLGATEFQIGLLAALPFLASLASMPASAMTERTGARKVIFLAGLYTQRLLWLPIALVPLWLFHRGGAHRGLAVGAFMLLILLMHAAGAVGGPAWLSWMADIVPDRVRGKYFSRRRQWGIVSAIPTALLAGWLLDKMAPAASGSSNPDATLRCCAIIFLCAAVFGVVDITFFRYVPDVPMQPRRRTPMLRLMAGPLRDRQFLWFAAFVATLTFAITFMGQFVVFFLLDKVGVNGTGIQMMLLVAPMLAQLLVLPIWGAATDRMGKKPVLAIASLGLAPAALGWCFMKPGMLWLGYLLSIAGAVLWTGVEVANLNFVLEFSGSEKGENGGSSYVAVNSVIINIAGCLGGLLSGVVAKLLKDWHWQPPIAGVGSVTFYEVLFVSSAMLRLAAAGLFLPQLIEHKARGTVQTVRFIAANLGQNLIGAVWMPLRMFKAQPSLMARRMRTYGRVPPPAVPLRRAA
jgi:MFS family permease